MPVFFFSLSPPPQHFILWQQRDLSSAWRAWSCLLAPAPWGWRRAALRCGASQGQCGSPQLSHDGTPGCEHHRWAQAPAVPPLCSQPSLALNREGWHGRVLFNFLTHMSHTCFFGSSRISGVWSPLCSARELHVLPTSQNPAPRLQCPSWPRALWLHLQSLTECQIPKKIFFFSFLLVLLSPWWHLLCCSSGALEEAARWCFSLHSSCCLLCGQCVPRGTWLCPATLLLSFLSGGTASSLEHFLAFLLLFIFFFLGGQMRANAFSMGSLFLVVRSGVG